MCKKSLMNMQRLPLKHQKLKIVLAGIFVFIIFGLFFPYPWQSNKNHKSVSLLECQYCFGLTAPDCDTLYFSGIKNDSILTHLTCMPEKITQTSYGSAFWYSHHPLLHLSQGRLLTTVTIAGADTILPSLQSKASFLVTLQDTLVAKREEAINQQEKFLSYYMSTHNVIDEGYNQMGQHERDYKLMQEDITKVRQILKQIGSSQNIEFIVKATYIVHSLVGKDSLTIHSDTCQRVKVEDDVVELRTLSKTNAKGYYSITPALFTTLSGIANNKKKMATLVTYNYGPTVQTPLQDLHAHIIQGKVWKNGTHYETSIPLLERSEGSPLFDKYGRLLGIVHQQQIIPY